MSAPSLERELGVLARRRVGARPGQQEVGVVGAGAGRVLRVGALQAGVRSAQRVDAAGALRLVFDLALEVAERARAEQIHVRSRRDDDLREIDLQAAPPRRRPGGSSRS
jgi:hypothetical protein